MQHNKPKFIMSTEQSYVGRENYANPAQTRRSTLTTRQLTCQLVEQVAFLAGEPKYQIWSRVYDQLLRLYNINLLEYPRKGSEPLLVVAERYDLIDKVYSVAYAELLHYQSSQD